MRYAEHVATGVGPTWNAVRPRAEGYTSPLWICTLSLAARCPVDLESFAKAFGILMSFIAIALSGSLAWHLSTRTRATEERWLAPAMAMFLMSAYPATAVHAVSGMETALATALGAAYAVALTRFVEVRDQRYASLAAILGLAFGLCRPEANLIVGIASLATLAIVEQSRSVFVTAVLALHVIPGALYFAWRWSYYDVLLPLPFYVKAVLPDSHFSGVPEVIAFVRSVFIERFDVAIACVAAIAIERWKLLPHTLSALGLIAFLCLPAHQMGYDFRYFQPAMPVIAALAGVGTGELRARIGRGVPLIVIAIALVSMVPGLGRSIEDKRRYGRGVVRAHSAIGHALARIRHVSAHPVLATLDSGAIAFHSHWHVIDTWGLNDPVIATSGVRDADYVLDQNPSVVIVISSSPTEFNPHFEYERALFERSLARGLVHIATFEFTPDYHLFALAYPTSIEARALIEAAPR